MAPKPYNIHRVSTGAHFADTGEDFQSDSYNIVRIVYFLSPTIEVARRMMWSSSARRRPEGGIFGFLGGGAAPVAESPALEAGIIAFGARFPPVVRTTGAVWGHQWLRYL
jgi:hypothetical protein